MGRIIKTLLIVSIAVFHFSFFVFRLPKVFADTSCQPIYGGGQTCNTSSNIAIDKKILNPKTNLMVDNLGVNDPKYEPGFITTFQIKITNTGSKIFNSQIKDIFPQYVSFSAGPGVFDKNTKTLAFPVENLAPNESRVFTIFGRIADENSIPLANGSVCVVNQALAKTNTNDVAQDNSQFCLGKKTSVTAKSGFPVFPASPISKTPSTGPEALTLFSLIPIGIAGFFLRRKSKQELFP